jgi:serine/threonine protein kinase
VHRDLKLENILLENKLTLATKIVDFGFAEPINNNILTSKAGTPGYIAPEVFQNEPYGEKGDMFSLGIILFSMIGGYSPFKGRTYKRIMNENKDAIIQFDKPVWDDISPECKHLITLMTQARPINRISFTEIF